MSDEIVSRAGLGAMVAGWFVRPAGAVGERSARRVLASVDEPVVLAGPGATALGVGATVALAAADRGEVAVLACWRVPAAERRRDGLAVAKARRLAGSLQARGLEATASGRLVVVALPDDEREAVMLLRRAEGACATAACVPLLGGARGAAWDVVLAERGVAVLDPGASGERAALLEVAVARLAAQGVQARVPQRRLGAVARALAVSGWLPPGGRALANPVPAR